MMKEKILSVQNITKTFASEKFVVKALKNISFDLYKGEMLAIMGTSGSGKSTLLNTLGALDKPDDGTICINDKKDNKMFTEPHATKFRSDNIGFIFQSFHLLKDLTVEENIALPLILKGLNIKEIIGKVNEMLKVVHLTEWRKQRPAQLSGGQQQRVAIGRALITSPPIVLADEPTGNLDFNTSTEILKMIVSTKEKLQQSIVIVTHDPNVATSADRVLFFHDGEIRDEYQCQQNQDNMENILNKFRKLLEMST